MNRQDKAKDALCNGFESISAMGHEVKRKLDNGEYDDNPVVDALERIHRAASDTSDKVSRAASRIRKGYDGLDIWNLGDRLVLRLADFIDGSISTGSCELLDESPAVDELRDMADCLRGYALTDGGGDGLWHLSMFRNGEGREVIDDVYETSRHHFLKAWERFAEIYLAGNIRDDNTDVPLAETVLLNLRGKPNTRNLRYARIYELRRMSGMLRDLCESSIGYPYGYGMSDSPYETLVKHEKGWEDGPIPISARFWGNQDVFEKNPSTVREADVGYVAYICDLVEVAEVIDAWASWLDGQERGFDADDPSYAVMSTLRRFGEGNLFDGVEDRLRSGFLATWKWFGTIVTSVWV